jgi:isopenicillin N synthase-like dioxygenase
MRIPVVDLKPFLYGAPSERLGAARGFGDALETTGFAVIVGHDVPEALASETYATMKAYFALPPQTAQEFEDRACRRRVADAKRQTVPLISDDVLRARFPINWNVARGNEAVTTSGTAST